MCDSCLDLGVDSVWGCHLYPEDLLAEVGVPDADVAVAARHKEVATVAREDDVVHLVVVARAAQLGLEVRGRDVVPVRLRRAWGPWTDKAGRKVRSDALHSRAAYEVNVWPSMSPDDLCQASLYVHAKYPFLGSWAGTMDVTLPNSSARRPDA